jgi:hypothetical protein
MPVIPAAADPDVAIHHDRGNHDYATDHGAFLDDRGGRRRLSDHDWCGLRDDDWRRPGHSHARSRRSRIRHDRCGLGDDDRRRRGRFINDNFGTAAIHGTFFVHDSAGTSRQR